MFIARITDCFGKGCFGGGTETTRKNSGFWARLPIPVLREGKNNGLQEIGRKELVYKAVTIIIISMVAISRQLTLTVVSVELLSWEVCADSDLSAPVEHSAIFSTLHARWVFGNDW